jgi:hypothetical protein
MKLAALVVLFTFNACVVNAQYTNPTIQIVKFTITAPAIGTYEPLLPDFSGETITINNSSFHYTESTDVGGIKMPDFSGPLLLFKDHIYLDNTNVPDPYRIAGIADGRPVLINSEGFRQWRKSKEVSNWNILYIVEKKKSIDQN